MTTTKNMAFTTLIIGMIIASCSSADNYRALYHALKTEYQKLDQKYVKVSQDNERLRAENIDDHAEIKRLSDELETLKRTITTKSPYAQILKLYNDQKKYNERLKEDLSLLDIEADILLEDLKALVKYTDPKIPAVKIALDKNENVTIDGILLVPAKR